MNFTDSQIVLIIYICSNIAGALFLLAAIKKPKLARLLFVLLFGWACYINYTTAHHNPELYLDYGQGAIALYRNFINGWFSEHVTAFVSFIAIGQGLIALGMLLKGIWVKLACLGVIAFLMGIAPLGYYAAFPFSLVVSAAAFFIILKDDLDYLWRFKKRKYAMF